MRRQVDATHFDIDATKGYAKFAFVTPRPLDWPEIADTADSAGYTVNDYQVVIEGTIVRAPCEVCREEVTFLRDKRSKFLFELTGEVPESGTFRLVTLASGWEEGHTTFEVQEAQRLPDATPADSPPVK